MSAEVYIIPTFLHESNLNTLPTYILNTVENCNVFFVENERSARRYLKQLKREIIIDDYEWFTIGKVEKEILQTFREKILEGKIVGIISEAGCPGVADPGQILVNVAQQMNAKIVPLVGPSSILLALMASGMNGQRFSFVGYLPIDNLERSKYIKELESESAKRNCTQIFIETPYRNQQLFEALIKHLHPETRLCIAVDITSTQEYIKTKYIKQWKQEQINLHKKLAIFLLKS